MRHRPYGHQRGLLAGRAEVTRDVRAAARRLADEVLFPDAMHVDGNLMTATDAAELVLRALGVASQEAKDLATQPLPDLPGSS